MLSASDAREDILEALEAGVHGYIVKSERTDPLIERLRYVLSGEIYVPPALAERPAHPVEKVEVRKPGALPIETLSDRQRQVLKVVEGMSNKEIARSLALSEGTVKMHLAALFRALASNRAHAAALGKQMLGIPAASASRGNGERGFGEGHRHHEAPAAAGQRLRREGMAEGAAEVGDGGGSERELGLPGPRRSSMKAPLASAAGAPGPR